MRLRMPTSLTSNGGEANPRAAASSLAAAKVSSSTVRPVSNTPSSTKMDSFMS
jgi:hypothetical protein